MNKFTEILYDFNNSKSLKIYPRKNRPNFSEINFSGELKARRALNASEKELKHVMEAANRRLERISSMVEASVKSGYHLEEEVFIPEYLGFIDVPPEGPNDIRVWSKSGFNMARMDDKWVITGPNNLKATVKIRNMFEGIIILSSFGLDVNVTDYMNAEYRTDKPIEQIIVEEQDKVIAMRTQNTLGNDEGR